jgi:hypothetical protein
MKKVILGGLLLGLLTTMCFAQRGARSMGSIGPNARMAPHMGVPPDAESFPRNVGPTVSHVGPNIGVGTHAKTIGPNAVSGSNSKSVGPNVGPGSNSKTVGPNVDPEATSTVRPDVAPGTRARTIGPDATQPLETGPAPQ